MFGVENNGRLDGLTEMVLAHGHNEVRGPVADDGVMNLGGVPYLLTQLLNEMAKLC